jgi:hypothetical protein
MRVAAALIGVLLLHPASPPRALAQESAEPRFYARTPIAPEARRHISAALFGGYGWTLNPASIDQLNGFAAGFGARGGFDIQSIYVGLRLQFFMGDSRISPEGEINFDETMVGLDLGYEFEFGRFTLRPQLGIGLAMSSAELLAGADVTTDRSSDAAYLAPGVVWTANVTRRLFLALDLSIPFVLRDPRLDGLSAMLATGMRF